MAESVKTYIADLYARREIERARLLRVAIEAIHRQINQDCEHALLTTCNQRLEHLTQTLGMSRLDALRLVSVECQILDDDDSQMPFTLNRELEFLEGDNGG